MLNQRECFVLVQYPVLPFLCTVGHGPKDDLGDLEARVAQSTSLALSLWGGVYFREGYHTGCIPSGFEQPFWTYTTQYRRQGLCRVEGCRQG